MDKDSILINTNNLKDNCNKKFCKKYSVKINIIIVFLVIITMLQSLSLFYLIIMSNAIQKLHLYEFNNTELSDYLHKFQSIIDYVCVNIIKC